MEGGRWMEGMQKVGARRVGRRRGKKKVPGDEPAALFEI